MTGFVAFRVCETCKEIGILRYALRLHQELVHGHRGIKSQYLP